MIIAGLDVGTTKVTTVIGELAPDGVLDIIGEGTVAQARAPEDGVVLVPQQGGVPMQQVPQDGGGGGLTQQGGGLY